MQTRNINTIQCDLYSTNMIQKVRFMTHYYNLDTTIVYNFRNYRSITTDFVKFDLYFITTFVKFNLYFVTYLYKIVT